MVIESQTAANGEPTLCAVHPDGRRVLLHGGRDPSAEAERWVATLALDADAYLVFGLGYGYAVLALLRRIGEATPVFVIEPEPAVLQFAQRVTGVAAALASGRVGLGGDWPSAAAWVTQQAVAWDRVSLLGSAAYVRVFGESHGRVATMWRALHGCPKAPPELLTHAPGVSVVVPSYNRPAETAAVVGMLLRQHGVAGGFEVLVVNDNGTREVFDAVAHLDPVDDVVIRCYDTHYPGYGLALARNVGIRFARFDTVVCLDDDLDIPDGLLAAYQAAPDGLRLGRIDQVVDVHGSTRLIADPRGSLMQGPSRRIDDLERYRGFLYGGNFAVPTAIALAVGGFDEAFLDEGEEDMDFGARVMASTRCAVTVPAARVLHRGPTLVTAHALGLPASAPRPGRAHARLEQPGRGPVVNGGLAYWLDDRWSRTIVADPLHA